MRESNIEGVFCRKDQAPAGRSARRREVRVEPGRRYRRGLRLAQGGHGRRRRADGQLLGQLGSESFDWGKMDLQGADGGAAALKGSTIEKTRGPRPRGRGRARAERPGADRRQGVQQAARGEPDAAHAGAVELAARHVRDAALHLRAAAGDERRAGHERVRRAPPRCGARARRAAPRGALFF